ncbi:response regulator transcription factor [Cohnella cholangitidis]|uniref:Helix-turn-helix transcriptional regulator n=1 Tax=Cohnella cholangitidis TaxID=2598458 RepID=A0A7G5BYD0_9BACL|nr:helix-turn-helix transcriptional regulator [Cohnella cholangitidis]QMV41964.1 helix-turn-helix transcriptional regulator [Cohnella cholangitidis]
MQHESSYLSDVVANFAKSFGLTEREREIVYCLSRYGYSNRLLANELFITEKTVKNHIAKIQEKTKTCSTRELLSMVVSQSIMHHLKFEEETVAIAL